MGNVTGNNTDPSTAAAKPSMLTPRYWTSTARKTITHCIECDCEFSQGEEDSEKSAQMLPCLHTFCNKCVQDAEKNIKENGCIACRQKIDKFEVKPNFLVQSKLKKAAKSNESANAKLEGAGVHAPSEKEPTCSYVDCEQSPTKGCYNCGAVICESCLENVHQKVPVFRDHHVVSYSEWKASQGKERCIHHRVELDQFCEDCRSLFCSRCLPQAHKDHTSCALSEWETRNKSKSEANGICGSLPWIKKSLEEKFERCRRTKEDIILQVDTRIQNIVENAKKACDTLEKEKVNALARIDRNIQDYEKVNMKLLELENCAKSVQETGKELDKLHGVMVNFAEGLLPKPEEKEGVSTLFNPAQRTTQPDAIRNVFGDCHCHGQDGQQFTFKYPMGCALYHNKIHSGDFVFVVDKDNHRVQVFESTTEKYLRTLGEGKLNNPTGIALSISDKNPYDDMIFIANSGRKCVVRFKLDLGNWLDADPIQFEGKPCGLAAFEDTIFVSIHDKSEDYIVKVVKATETPQVEKIIYNLDKPMGMAISSTPGAPPLLYVAESGKHRIQVYNLDGESAGAPIECSKCPHDLAVVVPKTPSSIYMKGRLFVASYEGVQMFDLDGYKDLQDSLPAYGFKGAKKGCMFSGVAAHLCENENRIKIFTTSHENNKLEFSYI